MPPVEGFKEVPTYDLEILVAVSAAIQTVIFGYHFARYDCKYENPVWINMLTLFLLLFFVMAILITTVGYKWTTIDLTIYAFDNADAQNVAYYVGICLLYTGNALFIWLEYHLHAGIQSPWMDNDINMNRIILSMHQIKELKTKPVDEQVVNKQLIRSGPFKCCRYTLSPFDLLLFFHSHVSRSDIQLCQLCCHGNLDMA